MLESGWPRIAPTRRHARREPGSELGPASRQPAARAIGREAVTSENIKAVSQRIVKVLLISPFDEDHRDLREILRHSNWQQHEARTLVGALGFLQDNPTPVVICEAELPDGTWKDVLAQLALIKCPPILVVSARLADEKLWSEVLRLGGYNVLVKPLNMQEVSRVVSFSWLLWKNLWDRPLPYARSVQCGAL